MSDGMRNKLAAAGLVGGIRGVTLGSWLDTYFTDRAGELKPSSIRKMKQTKAKLVAYFGRDKPITKIDKTAAKAWRNQLDLSRSSVGAHTGFAKTIFNEAFERELINANPFAPLESGTQAAKSIYIEPETIDKFVDAAPDHEWKLLFGLARYGGLRIPSESHRLTWGDVNWSEAKLHVRSPKTERHDGHEARMVPIEPRLMALLRDAFDAAPEGEEYLVRIRGGGAVRRRVKAIAKVAGVTLWPNLWKALRDSLAIEWRERFPEYAVDGWLGHSNRIARKHYANAIPDHLFVEAAGGALQKAQHGEATEGDFGLPGATNEVQRLAKKENLNTCDSKGLGKWSRGESNSRPVTVNMTLLRVYSLI